MRPDPARHPDRGAAVDEVAALLDVQLDEAADAVRAGRTPVPIVRVRARRPPARPAGARRPGRAAPARAPRAVAPVASREPRQARPNRDPSSSANTDDPDRPGRARTRARAARSTAASAETTPSGPSYAPPSSTESRWEPVRTAVAASSVPAGSHQATRLPRPSLSTAQPAGASPARRTTRRSSRLGARRTAGGSSRRTTPTARPAPGRATSARSRQAWCAPWSSTTSSAAAGWSAATPTEPVDPAVVDRALAQRRPRAERRVQPGLGVPACSTPPTTSTRFWAATADPATWPTPTAWLRGHDAGAGGDRAAARARRPTSTGTPSRDKGWTDRDEARWPMPFWHMDAAMATPADPADRGRRGSGGLLLRHPARKRTRRCAPRFAIPDDHRPGRRDHARATPRRHRGWPARRPADGVLRSTRWSTAAPGESAGLRGVLCHFAGIAIHPG